MIRRASLLGALALTGCDACIEQPTVIGIDPIASCVQTTGDVRRRLARGVAWGSIASGTDLFSGDWVQTAARASARVRYLDGAELLVEPSTTVVIELEGEDEDEALRRIAVQRGSVRTGVGGRGRRPVEVRLPTGQTLAVRPGSGAPEADVRIAVDEDGAAELAVTRGRVAVTTVSGGSIDISSGAARSISAGELGPERALPRAPELSVDTAQPYEGEPVQLSWTEPEPNRSFVVELAPGDELAADAMRTGRTPRLAWTPPAAATWTARVFAVDAEGLRSPPSNAVRIEVRVDDRLRLLTAPPDGTVYRVPTGRARVELSWDAHPEGGGYRVTVAKDPQLEEVVFSLEVEASPHAAMLRPGSYFWGVHRGDDPLFVLPWRFRVARSGVELQVPTQLDWSRR